MNDSPDDLPSDPQDHLGPGADGVLMGRIAALPRELSLGGDQWPQIQRRIDAAAKPQATPVRPARWSPLAVAAALAIAVLASVVVNLIAESPQDALTQGPGAGNLPLLSASAELEYSGALQNLMPLTLGAAQAQPGSPLAAYEQSLLVVRGATQAVRLALESDPGSRYLNTMLTDLQHRQLTVLKEMAREADNTNPRRTT